MEALNKNEGPRDRRTLKEKWKDHWETRDEIFAPKPDKANRFGIGFFWFFTTVMMYCATRITIPYVFQRDVHKCFYMTVFAWFIYAQSVIHWILMVIRRSKCPADAAPPQGWNKLLMESLRDGWKSCPTCQLDVPPRAHHCKVCRMCVLKRDHHCFFTGSCTGFSNQRNFIVFVFYIGVGSVYALWLILKYLHDPLPLLSSRALTYLPPVALWKWMMGAIFTRHLVLLIVMYACIITGLGSIGFFLWQMCMVLRGQTTHEATHGIHKYRRGIFQNLRSVFGPFWLLYFLIPLPTRQDGDGINWPTQKGDKGN